MKFGSIKIADPTVCAYPTCSESASVTWKGMPVCDVHYQLARFIDAVVSGEQTADSWGVYVPEKVNKK